MGTQGHLGLPRVTKLDSRCSPETELSPTCPLSASCAKSAEKTSIPPGYHPATLIFHSAVFCQLRQFCHWGMSIRSWTLPRCRLHHRQHRRADGFGEFRPRFHHPGQFRRQGLGSTLCIVGPQNYARDLLECCSKLVFTSIYPCIIVRPYLCKVLLGMCAPVVHVLNNPGYPATLVRFPPVYSAVPVNTRGSDLRQRFFVPTASRRAPLRTITSALRAWRRTLRHISSSPRRPWVRYSKPHFSHTCRAVWFPASTLSLIASKPSSHAS